MVPEKKIQKPIIIIGPLGRGGISTIISYYIQVLTENNVRVFHVPTTCGTTMTKKIITFLSACQMLLCKIKEPGVCHLHSSSHRSFVRKAILLLLCRIRGHKVIFHIHSGSFSSFYIHSIQPCRFIIKFILAQCDILATLSMSLLSELKHHFSPKQMIVIPNCIVVPTQTSKLDQPCILFMGRLTRRKGIYDLLSAFQRIHYHFPDTRLIFAGEEIPKELLSAIKYLELDTSITLTGWLNESQKKEIFLKSTIFTLPSYSEGVPLSLLEAMSYGLSCIVSSVGGMKDIILDNTNGLLMKPGDIEELVEHLSFLLTNPSKCSEIGHAARKYVETHHDLNHLFHHLHSLYTHESLQKKI